MDIGLWECVALFPNTDSLVLSTTALICCLNEKDCSVFTLPYLLASLYVPHVCSELYLRRICVLLAALFCLFDYVYNKKKKF